VIKRTAAFLFLTALLFSACRKYKEGPDFTLLSKKARLCGSWQVELVTKNGKDATSAFYPNNGYTETFQRSGDYFYYVYGPNAHKGYGKWRWSDHKFEVVRSSSSNSADRTIHILKLENRVLWYNYLDGKDYYEVHLICTDGWVD
jgi:hypothetical protein